MHIAHPSGAKTAKVAAVVVFHLVLGCILVKALNVKLLALPHLQVPIDLTLTTPRPVDPPPLAPPAVPPLLAAPTIVVPLPEVRSAAPPAPSVTATTTQADPPVPRGAMGATPGLAAPGSADAAPRTRKAVVTEGCMPPAYPARAAREGATGTVTLALLVGVDGKVGASRIERSSGSRELDQAAQAALSLCRFKPAMQGDVPEAGWALIAFDWKLD